MRFDILINHLCNCTATKILNLVRKDVNVKNLKLLTPQLENISESTIYYGFTNHLPQTVQPEKIIGSFICFGEVEQIPKTFLHENHNLIHITSNEDLFSIFNSLQELLDEETLLNREMEPIYQALFNDRGLQSITNIATTIFGNPIFVIDRSYRYLSISNNVQFDDLRMVNEKDAGYIFKEGVDQIKRMGIDNKIIKKGEPFYFVNPLFHKGMLVDAIKMGNVVIGHVMIYEMNRPISERDRKRIQQFTSILSIELRKDPFFAGNKGNRFSNAIAEILDHKLQDSESIYHRIEVLDFKVKEYMYILSIEIKEYQTPFKSIEGIMTQIQFLLPESIQIIYHNSIVILLNVKEKIEMNDDTFQTFQQFLKENKLIAGLSNSFQDLIDMRKCYRQTLSAINIGKSLKLSQNLYEYKNIALYHLLRVCEDASEDLLTFCHPLIIDLIQYDKKNNSELTQTLSLYLQHSKDTTRTSNLLHIHKNTLLYRINKIKALLQCNLEDGTGLLHFQLSFLILRYKGLI